MTERRILHNVNLNVVLAMALCISVCLGLRDCYKAYRYLTHADEAKCVRVEYLKGESDPTIATFEQHGTLFRGSCYDSADHACNKLHVGQWYAISDSGGRIRVCFEPTFVLSLLDQKVTGD